jgi:hypothetical protein
MNELALFAGAGGGILGGQLLGWKTICAVEYEPYAAAVLAQRQNDGILPPFPIWDDMLKSHIIISRENGKWTRSTNTGQSANASFAGNRSLQGIRIRRSDAALTHVAGRCKRAKPQKHVQFAGNSLFHLVQDTKLAPANAGLLFAYRAGSLIPWSKCATGLLFFAVRSLRDACGTKQTEPHRYWGIRSMNCAPILRPISRTECRGTTTEKEAKNGA